MAEAVSDTATASEPPQLSGWHIEGLLGSGGFASVYAARSQEGRVAAIKLAHRVDDARFAREAAALRAVGPPTCPRLFAEGRTDDGRTYLVMERLSGTPLADHLAGLPAQWMGLEQVVALVQTLCRAVDSIHRAGVCHRDIKPHNVFMADDGRLSLIDFGLARGTGAAEDLQAIAPELTRTGERMGTVLYMSPEQCHEAKDAASASDIYSLGVMVFELLSGRPPFVGDVAEVIAGHVSMRPPRVSQLADVPAALDDVMARAMAKLPEERFESAVQFAHVFERASHTIDGFAATEPTVQPARTSSRQRVCLCAVRSVVAADRLAERFASSGGQLARTGDEHYVFAFPGQPSAAVAVDLAVRCVQSLLDGDRTLSAVVHVCELRVRRTGDKVRVSGRSLEHLSDWLPGSEQPGIHLTEQAATEAPAVAERGQKPALDHSVSRSYVTLTAWTGHAETSGGSAAAATPLFGQGELVAAALEQARAAGENGRASITTIVGDAGMGKSRLLDEIREQLADGVRRIDIRVPPPSAGDPDAALRVLLEHGLSVKRSDPAERIEAACRDRLGDELAATAWPAVALILDSLSESDGRVAPILAAPGALRQSTARAAGTALRHLASQPLVITIDDAHCADQAALDAIEMATLAGEPVALWVCVTATSTLLELRPLWGERAGHAHSVTLGALADQPMRQLATRLLEPVEFVPEAVLSRLVEQAGGVPLYMVELVSALRAAGAIRRHRGTEEWYVAADEIAKVTAGGPTQALAAQSLAKLPEHLVGLAELCAVLGDDISTSEIDRMARQLPGQAAAVDPSFGLPRLARLGLLRRTRDKQFRFRHSVVREALEARLPPARRAELHRIVLGQLDGADASRSMRERVARHARGAGQHQLAASAHFELAEDDARRHRYVDADNHYSAVLDLLGTDDAAGRERALAGRGTIRYRLQRFPEALADLEAARTLAEARSDNERVAALLLDEATVLDWTHDFAESARRAERAFVGISTSHSEEVRMRGELARGRELFRQERMSDAIEHLTAAADKAKRIGDHEARIIALLLLAPALATAGKFEKSSARFSEVIEACRERGDALHLCAAYNNRLWLWMKQQKAEEAANDQRSVIGLARELGFAMLEWGATYNLAELLYWQGQAIEARPYAQRSFELGKRLSFPGPEPALLLARIHCALESWKQASAQVEWIHASIKGENISELAHALIRCVQLQIAAEADGGFAVEGWTELLHRVRTCTVVDELLEVLLICAKTAAANGAVALADDCLVEAKKAADPGGVWWKRIEALDGSLTSGR